MLNWNEIRNRAVQFAREWENEEREAEYASFWNEFFEVFGIRRRTVARYQQHVKRLKGNTGFIDLFWPGVLIVEHKSVGENLDSAYDQAGSYFDALPEEEKPRYIIVSNFILIRLYDLEGENGIEQFQCLLSDFPKHVRRFAFILGFQTRTYKEESPITIKAVSAIGKLYDALRASNYPPNEISTLLTRLVFCFFADDTGIFNRDSFKMYLEDRTEIDGSDIGYHLGAIFEVLNTPIEKRQTTLDEDLAALPYVNGGLFAEHLSSVFGTVSIRENILSCMSFDWSGISPAIFGSMFQSVMDEKARHDLGAHYTSEKNILKVISGLFLDDLHKELADAGTSHAKLDRLWNKIAAIALLDPACGCGNFLVVAYRELRRIELEIIKRFYAEKVEDIRRGSEAPGTFDITKISKLSIERMFGIEIESFPAAIARLSLWLADHIANTELGDHFGRPFAKLPLTEQPHIVEDNALTLDWESAVPKSQLTYVLGNPPFVGSKLMSDTQRKEITDLFQNAPGSGTLDFVCGWYAKASAYIQGTAIACAFVSTNSITQGEQVAVLWRLLNQRGIKIHFAHRTFKWSNEAPGKAAVYCVIIGFGTSPHPRPRIYEYADIRSEPHEILAQQINAYLVDAPNVLVESRGKPIADVPEIGIGNKPIDGGLYLFTPEEKEAFLEKEPKAEKFFKRWIGADEFLNGYERWCLWLGDAAPEEIAAMPEVLRRIQAVAEFRRLSKSAPTRKLAETPTRFHVENMPKDTYLVIPEVSSERRHYIPIGFIEPDTLASNLLKIVPNASLYHFGVLQSEMHMTWVRAVAGRLKSDYRYSKDIVYNNFPWPENPTKEQKEKVEQAAQSVLDARKQFPNATLADLYNPETMPLKLLEAHRALDRAVDACYGKRSFKTEAERLEFLFGLYGVYVGREAVKTKSVRAHSAYKRTTASSSA